ncbi:MAG: glycerophosphoryl diester phosphodiesterase membrane domain-containing protein [Anaerolineae bacterium]|nr:glycerophosphoryl diester phosphodiesterase membrane domain-containing protein [Anaerolineae bacterium]
MTTIAHPVLRPLRQGEILDRAIRLYRRHFLQFVAMLAIVQVPLILLQMLISLLAFSSSFDQLFTLLENPTAVPDEPLFGPAYLAGSSLQVAVFFVNLVLVRGIAAGALTTAVTASYLGEGVPGILGAYRRIRRHWASLGGAVLLALALSVVIVLWWLFVPCAGWLTGGGMLLYLWAVIVPLLAPLIVLEEQPAASAWRRAWELTRRRFWWVLAFAGILYVFNLLVVAGPAAVLGASGQLLLGDPANPTASSFALQTVVSSLTTLVTSLLYLPLQAAAITLLFLDLRVTTEGLDLSLQINRDRQPLETLARTAPAGAGEPLVRSSDLGQFALITVGIVTLYAVLAGALFGLIALLAAAAT